MLQQLRSAGFAEAAGFFLVANIAIFAGSVLLCRALGVFFSKKRIFDRWEPVEKLELLAAFTAIALNSGISMAGWMLWTHDLITLTQAGWIKSIFDCIAMVLAMDLGMYVFHRIAHFPVFYRWMHSFHHRHEATNPISLFVLHPVEVIGFGMLMILFLVIHPMSIAGLVAYLVLNVLFGTLGHCGVEPFPSLFSRAPLLRLVGTSTFHAGHHEHRKYNFGFYTLIWDKMFGTLDPGYNISFPRKPGLSKTPHG